MVDSGSAHSSGTRTLTSNVWGPSGTPLYVFGETHSENAPPSSAHSYWRSRPLAANTNVAVLLSVVTSGPDEIMGGGAMPEMLQLHSAGVGSTLPAASLARTAKSCSPNTRPVYVFGESHGWKLPASTASSRAH